MTGRSTHSPSNRPLVRRLRWPVLLPLILIAMGVGLYVFDYVNVNLWLERDAGRLEIYPTFLIVNQQEVAGDREEPLRQIDRVLMDEMRRDRRNVVTLSRSEIKYNLLHTRAYAKVFLETALPSQPDHRSRLSVLCELKRGHDGWEFAEPPVEKTME